VAWQHDNRDSVTVAARVRRERLLDSLSGARTLGGAATPADERNPVVVGVKPGRFALAYEVIVDDQHRELRFRYVDFVQFRRRAAR